MIHAESGGELAAALIGGWKIIRGGATSGDKKEP